MARFCRDNLYRMRMSKVREVEVGDFGVFVQLAVTKGVSNHELLHCDR
jgi:hypothetical protein